ncbi:RDD family protein [Gordonia neofelifaecis]|uniref:RDD domain containing protein n=1 Tax=Gordonia neofelifaecis NRRL B-59395 TaxID=644548 RepID=F1YHF1_9ACTN|nr:RDD family protein [Gordonia neofelifaecis]EGD55789.1 RDD domain containing protein [Gordonia neofelifaecis NRRL B-59395]
MARATGTWLSGPQFPGAQDNEYRGQDLGLPEVGPGSLAGGWLRVLGLLFDWLIAGGLAIVIFGVKSAEGSASSLEMTMRSAATPQLIIWFVIGVVAVALFGFTPGQFIAGTRVARVDLGSERGAAEASGESAKAAVGPVRALGRQVILIFVVPALINDYNGRAMHDRATGTALVRTR